ncbi:hypothetical protein [Sphingomonas sp.]|jgi:hypothetical protein|uniref:hypothetical protein n=2 Tax=Sphingomonadaceae TaxID=41297 RepID=UPI00095D8E94|nr:hypothetical protein [Sphingomonas sp.]MBN8810186.1 hypothetical protein [Sphingomonas sp.]OJY50757.1 MAG: hypothetical protein BGP17_20320 [Sphingomonas sp. 67-41]
MQRIAWPCLAVIATLATGQAASNAAAANVSGTSTKVAAAPVNACEKVKTTGWKAWLDKMPGPHKTPTLHVAGQATTSTGGWKLMLNRGATTKNLPPTQYFDFVAFAPTGPAPQVVTTAEVKAEIKNALPKYKEVVILCGKKAIATVPVKIVT